MIAPASLKHHASHGECDCECYPLRGMIAPASLKHDVWELRVLFFPATPGHDCPGLIEARGRAAAATRTRSRHSGA